MKKIILLIISSVLSLLLFTACSITKEPDTKTNNEPISTTSKEQDIREIAFNQLTVNDKDRISGAWNDSKLSKITLKEGMGNINDKSYIGKEVYLIDFATKDTIMPNNMIVYLTKDSKKLLGYGYVQ